MVSWKSENITNYLLYEEIKYKIIKKDNASDASWWRGFGYPTKQNVNNELERIPGFISCLSPPPSKIYFRPEKSK